MMVDLSTGTTIFIVNAANATINDNRGGLAARNGSSSDVKTFKHVSGFWEDDDLKEGNLVRIRGAVSQYGPYLPGPPKVKRRMHRCLRREEIVSNNPADVDSLLAFTAGQMVLRAKPQKGMGVYAGLYHSIVRNSIPMFISHSYFEQNEERLFSSHGFARTIEAEVVARAFLMDMSPLRRLFDHLGLTGVMAPRTVTEEFGPGADDVFGLQVGGEGTYIDRLDEARYLDGDIWIALGGGAKQTFVSRFLDLADRSDLKEESARLVEDARKLCPGGDLIAQFDEIDPVWRTTS